MKAVGTQAKADSLNIYIDERPGLTAGLFYTKE
jgi:hypothetical protein